MLTDDASNCSCDEYKTTRRGVLKGMGLLAGSTALATTTGGVFRQVAFAEQTNGHVLVVLSLRGGADGLSMVVPHGDPYYAPARPRTKIPTEQLLGADHMFGFHPGFAPLMPMWQERKLAAVQAVGLPQPNRSHFAAMEVLEDADPGSVERVGWLNRLVGLDVAPSPLHAVNMGSEMVPTALHGPTEVLGLRKTSMVGLPGPKSGPQATWKRTSLEELWIDDETAMGRAARSALSASTTLAPLASDSRATQTAATYPSTPFGDVMRDTSHLLKAQIGVKVVTVDFGSWDMHVGLGNLGSGSMAPKVDELARTLRAFFEDLGPLAENVTLVTISEFGRRVAENDDAGVDHGFGNVMLVMGSGVRGGRFYGSWPGLGAGKLINGDLAVTRDYRSVLTEILRSRTSADTSQVFPRFIPEPPLGFMS